MKSIKLYVAILAIPIIGAVGCNEGQMVPSLMYVQNPNMKMKNTHPKVEDCETNGWMSPNK